MKTDIPFLKYKAYKIREGSLKATSEAGSGHLTTALSAADLIAVLFFHVMNYDYHNPKNSDNDRFILSKGHGVPVFYAAMKEMGVLTEDELLTYRKIDSVLEGHPTPRFIYNEAATGSLGQGLSVGLGMAFSARFAKKDFYTYVMLGDSEMTEGSVWEAIEIAAYYKIDKLIAIVDFNRLGQSTETIDDHEIQKHSRRWNAFGWHTILINGHDVSEIINAFDEAKKVKNQPVVIIAKTFKGYGLDLVEDKEGFHGKAFLKEKLSELLKNLSQRFPDVANSNYPEPKKIDLIKKEMESKDKIFLEDPNYKIGDKIATRVAYGETLAKLGKYSEKILSLDAEVKNSTFAEIFEKEFPDRFIQCFIAEQNMIGMATGLASREFIPFSSTFAAFLTRAYDQIRMSAIGRVPLKIAGSHAGVSIGQDGPSQMGLEDITLMRALDKSIVLYPSDAVSAYKLVNLMANYDDGISYIRLTRAKTSVIYKNEEKFEIGGCKVLKQSDNDQVCVVSAGITLHEALKAYELLKKEGILISVVDVYSIKPLDDKTLLYYTLRANKKIITVEDHYLSGGLSEAICYALKNNSIIIESLAIKKLPRSGLPEELLEFHSIDYKAIISSVKNLIKF